MDNDRWVELVELVEAASGQTAVHGEARFRLSDIGADLDSAVRELQQVRRMLQRDARAGGKTFGELAQGWLKRISRVRPHNEKGHVKHMAPLAELTEIDLTKATIEGLLQSLSAGPLGAASVNKVRSTGRLIIKDAIGNGDWKGHNPFDLVRPLRQRKRLYTTLTLEEVGRVLPFLRPDRRRLVKLLIITGARPGEALGMLKVDVDLKKKMLKIRRSHGRNQTKTDVEREFPVHAELVGVLREAIDESPSTYVFPKPDGMRQREDTKLARMFRDAMGKAGVADGYRYSCRRKGCGFRVEHEDFQLEELRCPKCSFKLWCRAIPKPFRFYDLRHTAATLHRKAGCDPMVIQAMLGHAMNITDGTYTHLDEDYVRAEINKLKLGVAM